ncbi:hypothetical protein SARC_10131 [Sphaeroforma arctica JP610]|uniref:Uncharacterized protein n=1 Tax=Sphaeroforma arctica JP610 TaxID=667725 RepID=A0A0L0FLP6_9EUKA|nr:hypothetical protein SARC_10131 [Sphaeroforma arctica JP610]KNC77406.1 hypothetical protein SARC_10131 [Sphaeroforma arctica JP610]|eukprot:XP_014151308.1 hypothetical protein SARC_10131 [Sphaeroforma arctica JP610]
MSVTQGERMLRDQARAANKRNNAQTNMQVEDNSTNANKRHNTDNGAHNQNKQGGGGRHRKRKKHVKNVQAHTAWQCYPHIGVPIRKQFKPRGLSSEPRKMYRYQDCPLHLAKWKTSQRVMSTENTGGRKQT